MGNAWSVSCHARVTHCIIANEPALSCFELIASCCSLLACSLVVCAVEATVPATPTAQARRLGAKRLADPTLTQHR